MVATAPRCEEEVNKESSKFRYWWSWSSLLRNTQHIGDEDGSSCSLASSCFFEHRLVSRLYRLMHGFVCLITTWLHCRKRTLQKKKKACFAYSLLGYGGTEDFLYTHRGNDGYETALNALRAFFVQKVNVVAERNKFRQRAQRFGEPIVQYVAALRELLVTCDFGALRGRYD